jgi:hypothetical protein
MQFNFQLRDTLPKLAWCVYIKKGKKSIDVYHGAWVEVVENQFFFEGAWNGDFTEGDFINATVCMGSGAKIKGDHVIIATPTHTLERIHLLKTDQELFVSNSLVFLLSQADDNLDARYIFYLFDFISIRYGLHHYIRTIPTENGHQINLYYHCNIQIDRNFNITEHPKYIPDPFSQFDHYQTFLDESVSAIYTNANASTRKIRYSPITTTSSGYDSPAGSVFAKKIGCKEAIIFPEARPPQSVLKKVPARITDESRGREIAEKLGMHVREYDRLDYLKQSGFPEAEFYACGATGTDVVMAPLEDLLQQKMFFTGFHGDKVWDRYNKKSSPYIERGDTSGSGLSEFRLRIGFIHIPLPFFGCIQHESIHHISNAEEMRPWFMGNKYDRPIPRRIVEEAGISRHLFGQRENAITVVTNIEGLKKRMTYKSYQDFIRFYFQIRSFKPWRDLFIVNVFRLLYNIEKRIYSIITLLFKRLRIKITLTHFIPDTYKYFQGFQPLCIHWGIARTKERYNIDR